MTSRPLLTITLAYIAGIIAAWLFLKNPLVLYFLTAVFIIFLSGAFLWRIIKPSFFMALVLTSVFVTGGLAFWFSAAPSPGGLVEYTGYPVEVEGTIIEEPRRKDSYTTYRIKVHKVETREKSQPVKGHLLARIYHGEEVPLYWYGERLLLEGEIVEPKGQRNPGGFDYRFYLRTQGVDALMYLQPRQVASLGEGEVNPLAASSHKLRNLMIKGIQEGLPSPQAELLTAILFGQRHLLPESVQEDFIRSGTNQVVPS